jgi:hypothetical protein
MAEFTGALDFLLHWKQQTANLLQAAEDDVGILLTVDSEVSAWTRAVAAFADWKAAP